MGMVMVSQGGVLLITLADLKKNQMMLMIQVTTV